MKKIIALSCILLLAFVLIACPTESKAGKVTITYCDEGSDVIRLLSTNKADYGFIAEPAATNALKNPNLTSKLDDKTIDFQNEWKKLTGQDGFPQASLFIKNGLDGSIIAAFLEGVKDAGAWAEANPEAAVASVRANALTDTESTMPNITDGKVIERCNIRSLTEGLENYVETFLDKIGGVKPKDSGIYYTGGTGTVKEVLNVYMPDGATALALAYMMEYNSEIEDVEIRYHVVPPSTIASYVRSGSGDIVLLPTNAAIALYNTGEVNYKLASALTHGNLFIVGADNLADLEGKELAAIGQGNIPAMVLEYVLKSNNLEISIVE